MYIKLKSRHFDAIEVIEAKLHAAKHPQDFQDAFKDGRSTENCA
jgi:hypothetical protein